MKWQIFIGLGFLAAISLQGVEPLKTEDVVSAQTVPEVGFPVALRGDLDISEAATPAASDVKATVVQAAPGTPNADEAALAKAQAELKEKDALIEKLAKHLESALARLNQRGAPVINPNTSLVALSAVKAKLEEQNNLLKAKQDQLQAKMEDISKKSQLLDLENRQLFEALNGRPYTEKAQVRAVETDVRSSRHLAQDHD